MKHLQFNILLCQAANIKQLEKQKSFLWRQRSVKILRQGIKLEEIFTIIFLIILKDKKMHNSH